MSLDGSFEPDPSDVPLPPSTGRDSLDSVRSSQSYADSSFINGSQMTHLRLDSLREEPQVYLNGDGLQHDDPDARIQQLEEELGRTRGEKEAFETQYKGLLGKLTTMRNTLGDKLKQDADELDRREAEINELRERNEDLAATVETLKTELIQANEDSEHVHSELEQLRLHAFDSQKQTSEEASSRETALRDALEDLERVRIEREEWEEEAMRERVRREELVARVGSLEIELGTVKTEREIMREERDREAESAANLLAVLEEFQAAKDKEIKSTLGDLQVQLQTTTESLDDFKKRAADAEARLLGAENDSEKVLALTKEVKDKTLLIGKLRHDAVLLNEHLTEAMRRLKKDSNENSVDRRLVSNVLITFLNTPRGDTKRFEMLQLMSSILSWTDDQRERVGLQRSSGVSGSGVIASGSRLGSKGHSRSGRTTAADDGLQESESFGQLWVEFLLKEASNANNSSLKPTPSTSSSSTPPGSGATSPNDLNSRFDFSQLPPILSPPLISPTESTSPSKGSAAPAVSPRRSSFNLFRSTASAPTSSPTSRQVISEER